MSTPLSLKIARSLPNPFQWALSIHPSSIHGEARFMTNSEMNKYLHPKNTGIYFSEKYSLSLDDSFTNIITMAPTGTGKTTSCIIPNILQCLGSYVVTDPSGEIHKKTSGHMKNKGYNVCVFEPENPDFSHQFNAVFWAKDRRELKQLATTIAKKMEGNDPIWFVSATNILFIGLVAITEQSNPQYKNLANLRWLLNHFGVEGEGVAPFMSEHLDEFMFSEFKAFIAQDKKFISSIISTARASLDLWSDENIMSLTAENTIDISKLRTEKTIIYLIVPEHRVEYYGFLLNLFYSACFGYCLENPLKDNKLQKGELPIFFLLDEFGNMGKIDNFPRIANTLRKRACSLNIILQTFAQLPATYGEDNAKAIFRGGMANKLFLTGLDIEECAYIEKVLGYTTLYDTTFGGVEENARTIQKPLMSASDIRMLPKGEGIFISNSQIPIKIKIPPYFKTSLNKYCKFPPAPREEKKKTVEFIHFEEKERI